MGRRDVDGRQAAFCEMTYGKRPLDVVLSGQNPVHRSLRLVLAHVTQTESVVQRTGAPVDFVGRGELGPRGDETVGDHRHRELRRPRPPSADGPIELEAAEWTGDGGDVAVRDGAFDL